MRTMKVGQTIAFCRRSTIRVFARRDRPQKAMVCPTLAPLLLLLACLTLHAQPPAFPQRVQFIIDAYAHPKAAGPLGYLNIAAKLKLHEDAALCSRRLEELLEAGPTGDMFWMFPITAVAYLDQGQLSDSARRALRRSFKTYMPYRGDTENHWLLYYTSLYLMAQLWPDQDGGQWYTGKSSAENMREAAGWIESWVRLTTTRGQGEYDSPHYMGLFFLSMSYLSEWAKDPAMKQRATMMLDYLTADYAAENLDGIYVGAHSRVYDRPVGEKWFNVSSDFGWVLFGLGRPMEPPGNYVVCFVLAAAYQPPEILQRIATDRERPYTHYELKRTRNRWPASAPPKWCAAPMNSPSTSSSPTITCRRRNSRPRSPCSIPIARIARTRKRTCAAQGWPSS